MGEWLKRVKAPADLKDWPDRDLEALAAELREEIIAAVSRTGGHLGASLGAVELTVALHSVFDSPRDKIVWDIGHQAYAHKMLTGRYERFGTLRQRGGLSGFLRRSESPHDVWGAGHASTSISAALGMAKARDLLGEDYAVVAVIGDGAMTGGLAYEALNNAGALGTDLIVVLNDNSMSIAPNVGAVSEYLTWLRSDPAYRRLKQDMEAVLRAIPVIGGTVARSAERLKESLRHLLVPGGWFEALGIRYLGPIDGHRIPLLRRVLRRARSEGGPVLIHVVTEKGRGYPPAAADPEKLHGAGPFDLRTGRALAKPSQRPTYSDVFGQTLVRLAAKDPRIVAITAAMPNGTGLAAFAQAYPDRFFDVGIAEAHAVTFAAGLATQGLRPVVAVYSTFLQRAYDQVIHDVALQNLPVTFCLDRAGLVGEDGATHHGVFDLAYLRTVPNTTIAAPRNEAELARLLVTALSHPGPMFLRYPKGTGPGVPVPEEPEPLPVGRGELLRRGPDAVLVGLGATAAMVEEAAELLAHQGIHVTAVDMRFLKPLDEELLLEVCRPGCPVVVAEDGSLAGGLFGAVAEVLALKGVRGVSLYAVGVPADRFIEHGTRAELLEEVGLTARQLASRVVQGLGTSRDAS